MADRSVVAWMLAAFVVTFLVTRLVTRLIKAGRGPFRDMAVGGVHLHHQVFGILLLLVTGASALVFHPAGGWADTAAVLFGLGAALTLDEFALWLRLDDVYWGPEGRRSVDAVLVAVVIGLLLLAGFTPFDDDPDNGPVAALVLVGVNLLFAVPAILKGRTLMGICGLFVPLVALVATCRVARPGSWWARRFYRPGSRRHATSLRRFPPDRRPRWAPLVDLFAGRDPR